MEQKQSRAERATELYLSGYNCAQAVFASFCDLIGIDEKSALMTASALGGGVSGMREVCGAVTGAALALGSLGGYCDSGDYDGKKRLYGEVQALCDKFTEKHGSIVCRELLRGIQYGRIPAVRNEEYYSSRPCAGYIFTVASLLEDFLSDRFPNDENKL